MFFYKENIRFDDINKSQGIETKKRIQLNTANRFEITVDVRSHVDKYITIEDENEYILSVLKI